jgi:hypothetical protein
MSGVRNNTKLEVRVQPGTSRQAREAALQRWYRQQLRNRLPALIAKSEPVTGVKIAEMQDH